MPNLHKALEALTRLPQTPSQAVNELTASVRAVAADALKTLLERDAEIERLTSELYKLYAEQPLFFAVCTGCGEVTSCDEDRRCISCGRDLIILADRHSADLLIELNSKLSGLRRYLTRSIVPIGSLDEAVDLLNGLSSEDAAMVVRWIEAMRDPGYWSKDIARLTTELEQERERVRELEQSLAEASERRWSLTP